MSRGLSRLARDCAATILLERGVQQRLRGPMIAEATEVLLPSFAAVNCLINPDAIQIGGRLPAQLVDRLAASLSVRMADVAGQIPVVAHIACAVTVEDAPAVDAVILPFSTEYLPARAALPNTT